MIRNSLAFFLCLAACCLQCGEALDFLKTALPSMDFISAAEREKIIFHETNPANADAVLLTERKIICLQTIVRGVNQESRLFDIRKRMLRKKAELAPLRCLENQMILESLPSNLPGDMKNLLCRHFSGVWKIHVHNGVLCRAFEAGDDRFGVVSVLDRRNVSFPDGKPDSSQIRQAAIRFLAASIEKEMESLVPRSAVLIKFADSLKKLNPYHPYPAAARYAATGFDPKGKSWMENGDPEKVCGSFSKFPSCMREVLTASAESLGREKELRFFLE